MSTPCCRKAAWSRVDPEWIARWCNQCLGRRWQLSPVQPATDVTCHREPLSKPCVRAAIDVPVSACAAGLAAVRGVGFCAAAHAATTNGQTVTRCRKRMSHRRWRWEARTPCKVRRRIQPTYVVLCVVAGKPQDVAETRKARPQSDLAFLSKSGSTTSRSSLRSRPRGLSGPARSRTRRARLRRGS